MKVAIDARTLGSRPSGVGMYLNDFLKQLMKYEEFEFVLLSDVAESEYIKFFREHGIEVRTQGKRVDRSAGVYKYFRFIQKELDDIQPDIFWEVNTIIPVKLKGQFKTMITIHDMFPIEYVEYFGNIYSIYFKHNLKKTLKNADMILYNSEQTRKTTEEIFPVAKEIKNCNAYIIANPLKDQWETSDQDYFLYVGNMEKRKGVDLLLKGYERYRKLGGMKQLILAGKMQEEDINKLLQDTIERTQGITYLDYVDHDKKHQLFADCSCFVFPSKAEGFGMPIIEVMKFHKPILVSNLDIYDEIIGKCVNKFDIQCEEQQQVENLAQAMMTYTNEVDGSEYDCVVARYAPEMLGEKVKNFMSDLM